MAKHGTWHVDSAKKVGKRIRGARGSLSQRKLAMMVGVSAAYISRIEQGERVPTLQLLERIASALGVELDWLRGRAAPAAAPAAKQSHPISSAVIANELEAIDAALARIRLHLARANPRSRHGSSSS